MQRQLNIQKYNNIGSFYSALVIVASISLALALLIDFSHLHIYRHDAAYYRTAEEYFYNLKTEGRWINYLLYSVINAIPGRLAVVLDAVLLFLFTYVVSKRWTRSASYAFLIGLLVIHMSPLLSQVLWPALSLPAFLILFVAALTSPYVPVYVFYPLFGILFFGTLSHLYYLLPLTHLILLNDLSSKECFRTIIIKVVPSWILGFVVGYLSAVFVVYLLSGQVGIKVASWRHPNYLNSFKDLQTNLLGSYKSLLNHLMVLFADVWRALALIFAFLITSMGENRGRYLPVAVLSMLIIFAHYLVVVPIGIDVVFRTSIIAWLGVIAIVLFVPSIDNRRYYLLLPTILILSLSLYGVNHRSLTWYSTIMNTYFNELLLSTNSQPELYDGLIFMSSSEDVEKMTSHMSSEFHLNRGSMGRIQHDYRWKPVALEAGFKKVFLCKGWHRKHEVCKNAAKHMAGSIDADNVSGVYRKPITLDGYLIVALNNQVPKNTLNHK